MTVSGLPLQYAKRQIIGEYDSGDYRPVRVCSSGEVVVCSGLYVVADVEIIASSGLIVNISGQYVHLESGDVIDVLEYGYHILSGEWRPKAVCDSGEIVVCSGLYVVADIAESGIGVQVQSGAHVQISGQHVFVESGVYLASGLYVVADIAESGIGVQVQSGLHVIMSGQHFFQESGAYVNALVSGTVAVYGGTVTANISGIVTIISGNITVDSGLHVMISGQHLFQESGAHIVIESGIGVTTVTEISGTPVTISGDHVYVESGAYGTKETACTVIGRTARLVQVVGGSSGTYVGASSGGISLCVSGYWCSGPVHQLRIKNLDGNDFMFVGFEDCRPYSGWGYVMGGNDELPLDVCDPCYVYVVGNISGQMVSWIGTDY